MFKFEDKKSDINDIGGDAGRNELQQAKLPKLDRLKGGTNLKEAIDPRVAEAYKVYQNSKEYRTTTSVDKPNDAALAALRQETFEQYKKISNLDPQEAKIAFNQFVNKVGDGRIT